MPNIALGDIMKNVPDASQRAKKKPFSVIVIKSDVKIPSAQSGLVMTALFRGNRNEETVPNSTTP